MNGSIHLVLQGKGGVGKSFISWIMAQYFLDQGGPLYCADTDPVNHTFSRYKAFNAERIEILNGDNKVDSRVFDSLIEKLVTHEGNALIDNGAATFVPLSGYLAETRLLESLIADGKKVYIHTVLTASGGLDDTTTGLKMLIDTQVAPIVVWENEFFGKVEKDGLPFTESKLFTSNSDRIHGVVRLGDRTRDTFVRDLEILTADHLTFADAATNRKFNYASRSRVSQMKKDFFEQIGALEL